MIEFSGRGTHAAAASATVDVTVDAGGFWPTRGSLVTVWVRKTAGSATKFAWAVYSEDPAAPPTGEASEYLLAGGLNSVAGDARADCNDDADIPDVDVQFTAGIKWRPKTAAGINHLWVVLTYDAAADNAATVVVMGAPNPDPLLPQPAI